MVKRSEPASSAQEPCASCGEGTAVGSVFFSDRLTLRRQGHPDAFLCGLCNARIRSSYRKPQLTAEELDALTRNASALDLVWLSRY
jgi:hypothetical protein